MVIQKDYLKEINDYELLYMIHQDDEAALRILLEKYDRYLWALIREKWNKNWPNLDEQDVYMIAQAKVVEACNNYNEAKGASFQTFMTMCVLRRLATLRRTAYRELQGIPRYSMNDNKVKEQEDNFFYDVIENNQKLFNPDFYAEYRDLLRKAQIFVEGLSSEDRKIWTCMMHDLSYNEAAALLNISRKSYDNRVYKIKKQFRRYLKES